MWSTIQAYCAHFSDEAEKLLPQTRFLETVSNPFPRNLLPGHITGSGIVIRDQQILLIQHRYLKEWFQPGGHIDPGESPLDGAIRELEEETGWKTMPSNLFPGQLPIDIDVHMIPANPIKDEPKHLHIDFAYLLDPISQGHASDPEMVAWADIKDCSAPRLARCIQKYLDLKRA